MSSRPHSSAIRRVGQTVATDGENPDGGRGSFSITTPQQAKAELDRMNGDPKIAAILTDPSHAEHKTVKDKWSRLIDQANS